MTRRELLLAAAGARILRAQLPASVDYHDYPRCLPDYLRALESLAYARRNRSIAAAATPDAVRNRQRWARESFWKVAGPAPARTPLNIRTTGSFQRRTYRVEKMLYESRPGVLIAANLYVPQGSGLFPGVLFQMGHTPDGKAADSYQRCCQGLAQLGYVVLALDPMGQGERTNYPGANGMTRLASTDDEHTFPGQQMLLLGETATNWQAWDAMRSLDVLAAHPKVDPQRLASTGQSGGGTLTMMLGCVDDRLAAAAVSSGNTENFACQNFHPPGSTDDAEQDLIGSGALGFDRWDLLWPLAPKPLLVITSAKDFFGTYSPSYEQSNREEFAKLHAAYKTLGHVDAIQHVESPLPHGLSYAQRVAIYSFFEKHLKHSDRTITEEPTVAPEPGALLFAAPGGNVRNAGGKTPHELMQTLLPAHGTGAIDLARLLGIAPVQARAKVLATVPSAGCDVSAMEVQSAPQVWLPVWVFRKKNAAGRKLLLLNAGGRNHDWREGGLCHKLAAEGITVYAADLRGTGDLQPEFSPGAPAYTREHQRSSEYAWASLILGHSLLAQRVEDILALASAIGAMGVAASGELTVPALCAAAVERRIERIYLAGHLHSWRAVVEAENYSCPLSNFVPGILHHTDLPRMAESIAPRRLILAGVVDGAGRPMPVADARRGYSGRHIEIQEDPAWDFPALSGFRA